MVRKRRKNVVTEIHQVTNTQGKMNYDEAVRSFLVDRRIRNLSTHTLTYYSKKLNGFKEDLIKAGVNLEDITLISLETIKEATIVPGLENNSNPVSINTKLRAIRAFFNYLADNGFITKNPVENLNLVREPKKIVPSFTKEQVRNLLSIPDQTTFTGLRDYVLMLLMLETGVRLRELTEITLSDVNLQDGLIKVDGKGFKERSLPVQATMKKHLDRYLKARGKVEDVNTLFITIDNTPLSYRNIQWRIRNYGKLAKIEGVRVSPHTFRHSFSKFYILNGGDPFSLRHILGHTTFEMTNRYITMFSGETSSQHKKYSPLEGLF